MSAHHEQVTVAVRRAAAERGLALVPYLTAGYPRRETFLDTLERVAGAGDVVEIGVPFSDPMADGVTIQRASHAAIANGVSLDWILRTLEAGGPHTTPLVLMSYLNPLLRYGFERLASTAVRAGVSGFIVPDLPLEESGPFRQALERENLGLVQLVTPATPPARLEALCAASRGFVYAVTVTGITGGDGALPPGVGDYLDRVRAVSRLPVCAGFGVRGRTQLRALAGHADGAIVGSALVEELEAGRDPAVFLEGLRAGMVPASAGHG